MDEEETIRKIIHVDMDAFYASVEIRDRPELRGRPLVVGGRGGVVLTASYEARPWGIRSGMPGFQAAEACPGILFIRPRFAAYEEASRRTREIFRSYTDVLEPRSLDEAFLDVTVNKKSAFAVAIAREIRARVQAEVGITCSAGVSSNKLLAKIASDYRKPDGLTVVLPGQELAFMRPLPLRRIPGVGPATEQRLARAGLHTCADVLNLGLEGARARLGARYGSWLYRRAGGEDGSEVGRRGRRKSIGSQRSMRARRYPLSMLQERLDEIAGSISRRMAGKNYGGRTITVRLKYGDFRLISRSRTLERPVSDAGEIRSIARDLLAETDAGKALVRLVGISVSNLVVSEDPPGDLH